MCNLTHSLIPLEICLYSLEKREDLESFRRETQNCLEKHAPEYISSLSRMSIPMLAFLNMTTSYWETNLELSASMRQRFFETKLIECMAFWTGYSEAGGKYPPSNYISVSEKSFEQEIFGKRRKSDHNKIVAIVPIGHLNPTIEKILNKTLKVLEKNRFIARVYCIFDGFEPKTEFKRRFKKVESTVVNKRQGPANARNIGIDEGLSINMSDALFVDSDVTVSLDVLNHFLLEYNNLPEGLASPKILSDGMTRWDEYHNICGTLNGRYLVTKNSRQLLFGTTSCMLVPRTIFDSGTRFSRDFSAAAGEDIDFCLNARSNGYSIFSIDKVRVRHWYGYNSDQVHNWKIFKERFHRYGKSEVQVLKRQPAYYKLLSLSTERPST